MDTHRVPGGDVMAAACLLLTTVTPIGAWEACVYFALLVLVTVIGCTAAWWVVVEPTDRVDVQPRSRREPTTTTTTTTTTTDRVDAQPQLRKPTTTDRVDADITRVVRKGRAGA